MRIFFDLWKYNFFRLIVTAVSVLLALRYVLPFLSPFVIALVFVMIFRRGFARLEQKIHLPWGFQAGILLIVFAAIIVLFLAVLADQCMEFIGYCNQNSDYLASCCRKSLLHCCRCMQTYFGWNALAMEETIMKCMYGMWDEIYPKLMDVSYSYIGIIGTGIALVTVTVIAILLTAKDYMRIRNWAQERVFYIKVREIVAKILKLLKIYLKAQGIIMLCVSLISMSGLFACHIPYALPLGFLAGALDVLPFIGTGVVYVPIIIVQLLNGEVWKAAGCLLVYTICVFVRQILEPRLIGEKINIYPVFILLAVFFGLRLYGVLGIFLGPLSLFLIKEIYLQIRNNEQDRDRNSSQEEG